MSDTTPRQKFDAAQPVNFDINIVDELKITLSKINSDNGIIRSLFGSSLNIRPETEADLNNAILLSVTTVLDTKKSDLETEFDNILTPST